VPADDRQRHWQTGCKSAGNYRWRHQQTIAQEGGGGGGGSSGGGGVCVCFWPPVMNGLL
jgi:hypothetical protein